MSLHARILLAATLVLAACLGVTGFALDHAFQQRSDTAIRQQLMGHIYGLLAAADEDESGKMRLPAILSDPRFNTPDSGYYAQVEGGELAWRSPSLAGYMGKLTSEIKPGEPRYRKLKLSDKALYAVSFAITWETLEGSVRRYTFAAAEDMALHQVPLQEFRQTLWRWLGGMAVALLLVQGLVLRWGLRPLRQVAGDLEAVEGGQKVQLDTDYPSELQLLTRNINSLLQYNQKQQDRYRNSLGDLAHSLKTPLAVLQTEVDAIKQSDQLCHAVREQVGRMDGIIQHQLQKAAGSGRAVLAPPVAIEPIVEKIIHSLHKVYLEKQASSSMDIQPGICFRGDEGDLMELMGNLLDNAWKHCRSQVRVVAGQTEDGLTIKVEDDGPGIPEDQVASILQRGTRLDQQLPGQGLGLNMVQNIIELYGGRFTVSESGLGGASIEITIANQR